MKAQLLVCMVVGLTAAGCGRTRTEPPPPQPRPDAAPPYIGYPRVSAGTRLSCLVTADGKVECWGRDAEQYTLPDGERLIDVSVGGLSACGVRRSRTLLCWPGERGRWGSSLDYPDGDFRKVSVDGFNACGVRSDGRLACWGQPDDGLNDPPEGRFSDVAMGRSHACALRVEGTVVCWGANVAGSTDAPPGKFVSVVAGGSSCAMSAEGVVRCWGSSGQAYTGFNGRRARAVAAGDSSTCIINEQKELECKGDQVSTPPLPRGPFEQIDLGDYHGCGVRTDGTVACWGLNDEGQTSYGQSTPPRR